MVFIREENSVGARSAQWPLGGIAENGRIRRSCGAADSPAYIMPSKRGSQSDICGM